MKNDREQERNRDREARERGDSPRIGPQGTTQVGEGLTSETRGRQDELSAAQRGENIRGAPTEDSPAREQTERVERMQREGEREIRQAGSAGENRSESERVEAERQARAVREDAESRRDVEAPRSPERAEEEMRAGPRGRDQVRERQRRDREEMGRESMETQSRGMQEDVVERREREAEENELRDR